MNRDGKKDGKESTANRIATNSKDDKDSLASEKVIITAERDRDRILRRNRFKEGEVGHTGGAAPLGMPHNPAVAPPPVAVDGGVIGGEDSGLSLLLRERAEVLRGIVNGIDVSEWNPATDVHIPAHYTSAFLKVISSKAQ